MTASNLLASFIAEARDLVKRLVSNLLALEASPSSPELIEEIFRAMHTLKGSSGIFDLPAFTALTHAAEDILDTHRTTHEAIRSETIDHLLASTDLLVDWIDALESTGTLPPDASSASQAVVARFRNTGTDEGAAQPDLRGAPPRAVAGPGIPLDQRQIAEIEALLGAGDGHPSLTILRYAPDPQAFFGGDDPLLLVRKIPALVWWEIETREPWSPSDSFDPYVCNLVFTAVSGGDPDELAHLFRYVPDEIRLAPYVSGDALNEDIALGGPKATDSIASADDAARSALARRILAEQIEIVTQIDPDAVNLAGTMTSIATLAANLAAGLPSLQPHAEALKSDLRSTTGMASLEAARNNLEEMVRALDMTSDGSAVPPPATAAAVVEKPKAAPPSRAAAPAPLAARDHVDVQAAPAAQREPAPAAEKAPSAPIASFIRVEESRLDNLMNLIGELVVAKNALPFLAARADKEYNCPALAREISSQCSIVDRLAHEMQGAILQLRLMPVAEVFDRFPRLVRDVSRKLGKDVKLVIEGGDTEIDKAIVECLGDPMIHIVRNALDHGLETPEERAAFGKSRTATLRISARGEADQIIIEVSDDGRGVDTERVKVKAVERGILDEAEASAMTHEQALELIFRPGFSTSDSVSDLSGRGVGMDAVLTNIQRAGGRVHISSESGKGTTVSMSLPLSMAISRIVIVRVGEALYGIPMDLIFEMCRVSKTEIRRVRGREVAVLRGQVVPLVRLKDLFDGADPEIERPEHEVVVVTSCGNELFGFVVDDLHERMETIVKPMEGIIAGLPGFVGTALMGDGRVLLVMNPEELARVNAR